MTGAAVPVDPLTSAGNIFLSQGIMGAIVVALVYFIMVLRKDLRDERAAHKVEIAAKDALINDIQEARVREAQAAISVAKTSNSVMEALAEAARGKVSA